MLFDGDDQLFKNLASTCRVYGEYGCGASTAWIYHNTTSDIYSVDTDQNWSDRVSKEINDVRVKIAYIDVGSVGDWGYPLTFNRRHEFRDYCIWPWQQTRDIDLVLIDGRFRIACFLTCLKFARAGTRIIFDDYVNRPLYHVVEKWCRPMEFHGRQALFSVPNDTNFSVTDQDISEFINVLI
jgi:hypothetical protein